MLIQEIFHTYTQLMGWKWVNKYPEESQHCVLIAAPHTSNWDLIYGVGVSYKQGLPLHFTIKKEWMRFPFKNVLIELGALGIDRSPKKGGEQRQSMVQVMVELLHTKDRIAMGVTPEGTRKRNTSWKTGFWHVAKEAGVPICFGYLDYARKEVGIGDILYPSDDMAADMRVIMDFYKNIKGKKPHQFAIDESY